jgi:hypothetical protein
MATGRAAIVSRLKVAVARRPSRAAGPWPFVQATAAAITAWLIVSPIVDHVA